MSIKTKPYKLPHNIPCPRRQLHHRESVHDSLRWPNQLVSVLNQNGKQFEPATIVAQTGWTTDELAAAIDTITFAAPYDYVSLLIGVNNQYRGRSIDNFQKEFINLLETSITLAGQEGENVFVISIPDWGVMPLQKEEIVHKSL